jgi:S-adenosylmethionine/arginine decarboxylase-like enzyme
MGVPNRIVRDSTRNRFDSFDHSSAVKGLLWGRDEAASAGSSSRRQQRKTQSQSHILVHTYNSTETVGLPVTACRPRLAVMIRWNQEAVVSASMLCFQKIVH